MEALKVAQSTEIPEVAVQQSVTEGTASTDAPERPSSAVVARGSWAASIASRVMSEPESTGASDDLNTSWARSIASRAISVAEGVYPKALANSDDD